MPVIRVAAGVQMGLEDGSLCLLDLEEQHIVAVLAAQEDSAICSDDMCRYHRSIVANPAKLSMASR
jgi:hypothetical protein